jgi:hypothetical protein
MKVPSPHARRIAARLLKADQGGAIQLTEKVRQDCVHALTTGFLTVQLRGRLGGLWATHGRAVFAFDQREEDGYDRALNAGAGQVLRAGVSE